MARYVFVPTGGVVESDTALGAPLYEPVREPARKAPTKATRKAPAKAPAARRRKTGGE